MCGSRTMELYNKNSWTEATESDYGSFWLIHEYSVFTIWPSLQDREWPKARVDCQGLKDTIRHPRTVARPKNDKQTFVFEAHGASKHTICLIDSQ